MKTKYLTYITNESNLIHLHKIGIDPIASIFNSQYTRVKIIHLAMTEIEKKQTQFSLLSLQK